MEKKSKIKRITILGAGMWGRTIATLLSQNEIDIHLWDINPDLNPGLIAFFSKMKEKGHIFNSMPNFIPDLAEALEHTELLFCVLPTHAVRKVMSNTWQSIESNCPVIIATKGIEESTEGFSLMSKVVADEIGETHPVGVLSGPNLSTEIQNRHPAVSLVASANPELIETAMTLLVSDMFRVYGSTDVIGVQIGGAVKNVIALAAGMVDELGFEYNTKAALLTRGLVEITRLGTKMGGNRDTFYGISGLGDLICTASSPTSRNYRAGRLFGKNLKREKILMDITEVIEGIPNSKTVSDLADSMEVEMPISKGVYKIVWMGENPISVIKELMGRKLKFE